MMELQSEETSVCQVHKQQVICILLFQGQLSSKNYKPRNTQGWSEPVSG